ncbi:MAG: hypothetical protein AAF360_01220, partial [Pseudomonadota bacterium]
MPNTLAHLGIQTLVARAILKSADVKWIWAGCVIPDLPWILQRAVRALAPGVPVYDLRLYAITQSALALCLVLCAALACFSARPYRVFAILASGSLMHLLLDAMQTKWANGVHLFAPASWDLLNFGLFWPEDPQTWALTGFGLVAAIYAWARLPKEADDLRRPRGAALLAAPALFALYFAAPLALMEGAAAADNHFVTTLRDVAARPDRRVAFDRNRIQRAEDGDRLIAWTGESFALEATPPGVLPEESATVSIKG